MATIPRVALMWRGTMAEREAAKLAEGRFAAAATALAAQGAAPEPCVYAEEFEDAVEAQLAGADAVLVWVNPIHEGRDRRHLDALLVRLADRGVLVSAHPRAIMAIGTKEVLFRTRHMAWGSDVQLYPSLAALQAMLPGRLTDGAVRVLKQNRGHSGIGVWRVEQVDAPASGSLDMAVRVRQAPRGSPEEVMTLRDFTARCAGYFAEGVLMIEQPLFRPSPLRPSSPICDASLLFRRTDAVR